VNALISIERCTCTVNGCQPYVTQLVGFGPRLLSNMRKINVETTLELPLPPRGLKARGYGAGVAVVPEW
jgi:hypothetical protein